MSRRLPSRPEAQGTFEMIKMTAHKRFCFAASGPHCLCLVRGLIFEWLAREDLGASAVSALPARSFVVGLVLGGDFFVFASLVFASTGGPDFFLARVFTGLPILKRRLLSVEGPATKSESSVRLSQSGARGLERSPGRFPRKAQISLGLSLVKTTFSCRLEQTWPWLSFKLWFWRGAEIPEGRPQTSISESHGDEVDVPAKPNKTKDTNELKRETN